MFCCIQTFKFFSFRYTDTNSFLQDCEENQVTYNGPSCDADNTQ